MSTVPHRGLGFNISKRSQFAYGGIESLFEVNSNRETSLYSKKSKQDDSIYTCYRGNLEGFDPVTGIFTVPMTGFYKITIFSKYDVYYAKRKDLEGSTFTKALIGDRILMGSTNDFMQDKDKYSSSSLTSGIFQLDENEEMVLKLYQSNKLNYEAYVNVELFIQYLYRYDEDLYENKYSGEKCKPNPRKITFDFEKLKTTKQYLRGRLDYESALALNILNYFIEKKEFEKSRIGAIPKIPLRREKPGKPPLSRMRSTENLFKGGSDKPNIFQRKPVGPAKTLKPTFTFKSPPVEKLTHSGGSKTSATKTLAATSTPFVPGGSAKEFEGASGKKPNLHILTDDFDLVTQFKHNIPKFDSFQILLKSGEDILFYPEDFYKITIKGGRGFKIVTNDPTILKYTGTNNPKVKAIQILYGDDQISNYDKFAITKFRS